MAKSKRGNGVLECWSNEISILQHSNTPIVYFIMSESYWEQRYQTHDMPWEKGTPSPGLVDFLAAHPNLPRGTVAVPGCGTGHDAREFARAGFNTFGFDVAPSAIRLSNERTVAAGLKATFQQLDFLRDKPPQLFDWIFEHTLFCGGWFDSNVYAPYRDISEVENYQLPKAGNEVVLRGQQLFHANCELCHNADGMGKPGQAPPMAGSEWVNAEGVNRLIRIPQVGLNGPLTIKGQEWNLAMAPMGAAYSHEDLAAVLTYIRQAWGNQASAVTPDQVKAVRAALAGHPMSYTVEELKSLPEK
jgi:mono/diheme cytochrome c family protein